MPTYSYACKSCGSTSEIDRSVSERNRLPHCRTCNSALSRRYSGVSLGRGSAEPFPETGGAVRKLDRSPINLVSNCETYDSRGGGLVVRGNQTVVADGFRSRNDQGVAIQAERGARIVGDRIEITRDH